ncbi:LPD11 domain-containing protein [Bacillus pumilus]|uniref:LPD11 domain-containing protein n=1 Tax=Bacillus pumilus TaxID=1408 RepID=UPI0011AAFD68|nr:LPD11 domain-containing protein [Bacillus pumilus]
MTQMNILKSDSKFRYMLLSRLQQDCDYYLGYGNKNKKHLWAADETDQIKVMKELWSSFAVDEKPEWLTWDDILALEAKMCEKIKVNEDIV